MFPVRARACFGLPLCKRGIEGDLLFAGNLPESNIKIKNKSPLAPLLQRGECNV
jgi:hypothetical protein